jgi:hypothetical protein
MVRTAGPELPTGARAGDSLARARLRAEHAQGVCTRAGKDAGHDIAVADRAATLLGRA